MPTLSSFTFAALAAEFFALCKPCSLVQSALAVPCPQSLHRRPPGHRGGQVWETATYNTLETELRLLASLTTALF